MKITIENTDELVELAAEDGAIVIPARLWVGQTESGIRVQCLVTRIAVAQSDDNSQFERELRETPPPHADVRMFPLRIIL